MAYYDFQVLEALQNIAMELRKIRETLEKEEKKDEWGEI